MILDEILVAKAEEVEAAKDRVPLAELENRVRNYLPDRSFRKALQRLGTLTLIAELKRKSPSKGMLRERFDPVSLAQQLQEAGAHALSVLTDERFFGGSLEFLRDVKQFTELPVLRKDFIIDPYQVYEAASYQADAVLLIVQILEEPQLIECLQAADHVGLDALVEVHSAAELETALRVGAGVIGINQRDLKTFTMQPEIAATLIPKIPTGKVIVVESGIRSREELRQLKALGVHAVLIGESLMTASDPAAKVRELFDGIW